MNTYIKPESEQLPVDAFGADAAVSPLGGARLVHEREERGLSTEEMARQVTLSRRQIEQIENGGMSAFYGASHKRLATRKYADAFGIDLASLISASETPDGKGRRTTDTWPQEQVTEGEQRMLDKRGNKSALQLLPATTGRVEVIFIMVCTLAMLYSLLRGLISMFPGPAATSATAITSMSVATQAKAVKLLAPLSADAPAAPLPAADAHAEAAGEKEICRFDPATEVTERWAPAQARRSDTRLFLVSATEAGVCVTDASGTRKRISLRPGIAIAVVGRPPYLVRSDLLPHIRIYLQGLKVRVPPGTLSMQLFAAKSLRLQEPQAAPEPEKIRAQF